jgi:arylsulfatase A-like enzyme
MGSRGVYHDGWFAGVSGPRVPWAPDFAKIAAWDPDKDVWELYNLDEDYSQSKDLAKENPEKLAEMKVDIRQRS